MRSALDCAQAQELFSDYREGSLNALLRDDLEQHLSRCSDCRQLLAALDQVLEVLAAEEELEPGGDLARRAAEAALASKAGRGFRGLL
ncbi:MAG TPA: zf-HC2 domain-containing protein, partial [Vicinamibacteria bacterium]|nr:zf-HC2 domain-containing protein [Vicinamibacteria bacterium]